MLHADYTETQQPFLLLTKRRLPHFDQISQNLLDEIPNAIYFTPKTYFNER